MLRSTMTTSMNHVPSRRKAQEMQEMQEMREMREMRGLAGSGDCEQDGETKDGGDASFHGFRRMVFRWS